MTDTLTPLLTLWEFTQTDDEALAGDLRRRAHHEGAPALLIARAVRIRDQRIAAQVQVIPARFDERYDPSPEPIERRIS